MLRREWLLAVAVVGASLWGPSLARANTPLDLGEMRVALRTATNEENAFLESVVKMARTGQLPADIVESSFLWARKKPRNKFQYFKQALIFLAAQRGILLK